jgi:hypothetical protein
MGRQNDKAKTFSILEIPYTPPIFASNSLPILIISVNVLTAPADFLMGKETPVPIA